MSRVTFAHPPYSTMVVAAITALKSSSPSDVIRYIRDNYNVEEGYCEIPIQLALKRYLAKKQTEAKKPAAKKACTPKKAKKPTAKKATKTTPKKAAAKPKNTKKTPKKAAKKPTAKKPAAKKPAKKQ